MASRLTVIISQSAVRHGRNTDTEEALLTELMMTAGLDATLVGSLDGVQLDSTDYLCLSGFTQHIALVTSLSAKQVAEHWERLQLGGQVVQVGQAGERSGRRVYYLPLELGIQPILAQLKQLLVDRTVQTVGLSFPVKSLPVASNPAKPASAPSATERSDAVRSADATSGSPRIIPAVAQRESSDANARQVDDTGQSDAEWPDLDRLVDEFDALDL